VGEGEGVGEEEGEGEGEGEGQKESGRSKEEEAADGRAAAFEAGASLFLRLTPPSTPSLA
jgi:hypothetical protein